MHTMIKTSTQQPDAAVRADDRHQLAMYLMQSLGASINNPLADAIVSHLSDEFLAHWPANPQTPDELRHLIRACVQQGMREIGREV
jgi:hypothetical protein